MRIRVAKDLDRELHRCARVLEMFSARTSCHSWWPNQLRLLFFSLAHILIESIRSLALKGMELAKAQCGTIWLNLLKIGAVVIRNTRRVCMHFSSGCPLGSCDGTLLNQRSPERSASLGSRPVVQLFLYDSVVFGRGISARCVHIRLDGAVSG